MNSRERFNRVMAYQPVDRVPYFEEGLREETIEACPKSLNPTKAISGLKKTIVSSKF